MAFLLKIVRLITGFVLLLSALWLLTDFSLQSAGDTPQAPVDAQIVGGRDANPGEYPWQAYLIVAQSSQCGGSLINAQWILTAAHCVVFSGQLQTDVVVVLGEHQLSVPEADEEIRQASTVIAHPQYDDQTGNNDIALIKLNTPVAFNSRIVAIGLVNSPQDDNQVAVGSLATVSGWGLLAENGNAPDSLQTVSVPIISNTTCNAAYSGGITNNMLCAGFTQGGKDACQGDSGGPLVVPNGNSWKQAGVVSFGDGCARPSRYGVYTRISRYLNWINSTIGSAATATPTLTSTATATATPTPTSTPSTTPLPSPTFSATPPPSGKVNYLRNGDFEAGPNGDWAESSNHFGGSGSLIVTQPSVSAVITPLGSYAARLGGVDAEQAGLSQTVTLPPGSTARLRFFYRLLSDEDQCGDDQVLLQVNTTTLAVFNLCQANQNADWHESIHDLSAYVGKTFTLQLVISTDDQLISRFVIDNATLTVGDAVAVSTATPTISPTTITPVPTGASLLYLPLVLK